MRLAELAQHHNRKTFLECTTMPQLMYQQLKAFIIADRK
jgi:hypothetical protein